jgi:hypothetical protein
VGQGLDQPSFVRDAQELNLLHFAFDVDGGAEEEVVDASDADA